LRTFVDATGKSDHCVYGELIFMVARVAMDDTGPAGFPWNYDRREIFADGVIHAIGIYFGLSPAKRTAVKAIFSGANRGPGTGGPFVGEV
jgi:hypothetical protein